MTPASEYSRSYPWTTVAGALLVLVVFLAAAMAKNGWTFEYPLDDVYIHLAMAEQMAAGGYGVNAGEYASAASSPIYPFFLMPFAGTEAQRWLPLFWNILSLVAASWLLGLALARAGLGRAGLLLAFVAPFALFMFNTAYAGMENMAHGAASLAIVLGLWRFVETSRIGWLLPVGVLLAPAFRLEGLALGMAAGGVVLVLGRPLAGIALGVLAVVPIAVMSGFLTSLGLDPLPNSVTAKLPATTSAAEGLFSGMGANIASNAAVYGGRYLLALAIVTGLIAMVVVQKGDRPRGMVGLAVAAAAFAHLAFAATGWLDRYENYLILSTVAVLALLVAQFGQMVRWTILGLALAGGVFTYAPNIDNNLAGMRAIHLQQGEMSRFAKDHLRAPVAVNDLGYVAWDNPDYVLDLIGLASAEALELRLTEAPDGWADRLADAREVRVAMIYDNWIKEALGPEWVRVGRLVLLKHGGAFLGGDIVSFYARDAEAVRDVMPALRDWAESIPEGAGFVFDVEDSS
ncbi:MAG: hypothetical protein QNJ20_07710 [Paracoccaceae bacterium]|nr:hypothetical protein [Paracoccaceae bacterium]